ncbi:MAG: DNA alkylation repair protein [Bacteroidetes bacterium]|nr:DNA alkylation repair protein [Bacteroidota bacterium]MBU1115871.1 DNA alkylation repair protein [Bacteroidota bacterium]MBU1797985.1 DNA alkylation repair protein [Bacteroidota bacterium]
MSEYVESIKIVFSQNLNSDNAFYMAKYMKNKFEYYGIKSPLRKELCKPFLKKENLPTIEEIEGIIKELWNEPQRELQYFAMELLSKYSKLLKQDDYFLFEYMIKTKSWWDTVDYIAAIIVGNHFKLYPELKKSISEKWINANDMWLNRTAILFQLKYKQATDEKMLFSYIMKHNSSTEFFHRKAIGWALREYSKTNPKSVFKFVNENENRLSGLSKREALKIINKS